MITEIRGTPGLDTVLKEDLIEAVEDCRDLAVSFHCINDLRYDY